MPIVKKRIKKYFKDETGGHGGSLTRDGPNESEFVFIESIKFSKYLFKLKLPWVNHMQLWFAIISSHSVQRKASNSHEAKTKSLIEQQ